MEYRDELERMKHRPKRSRSEGERSRRPSEEDTERKRRIQENRKIRKKKKRRQTLIVLVLLLVVLGGFFFWRQRTRQDVWTVAAFGLDSRDGSLGKGALSDVIMVATVDHNSGEVKIVSVFRDTYMKVDSEGTYHKINQAYHRGGPDQAIAALEENLDIKIDDYIAFNWKAVVDGINILGGVDLEITPNEYGNGTTRGINGFIQATKEGTGVDSMHLSGPGMQHLDGVQAVAYARLRLMDTDFARTERQRKVIGLAMEKAKQADFSVLNNLLTTTLPQTSTSIGLDDLLPLAMNVSKYNIAESGGFPFARATADIGNKDCVVPLTLESNVVQLHQLLYGDTNYSAPSSIRTISNRIATDSGMGEVGENAPTGIPSGQQGGQPPATQPAGNQPSPQPAEEVTTEESTEELTTEETEETIEVMTEPETEDTTETTTTGEIGPGINIPPTTESEEGPGVTQPSTQDTGGPGVTQPETTQPETTRPEITQPETTVEVQPVGPGGPGEEATE